MAYEPNNFQSGFGNRDRNNPRAYRMLGFYKIREDVDSADESVPSGEPVIDIKDSENGINNVILLLARRTDGTGELDLTLWGWLANGDGNGGLLPFPVPVGDGTQSGESGYYRFENLPAGQYRVQLTGVGSGTWDIYAARPFN